MPKIKTETTPDFMVDIEIDDIKINSVGPWENIQSAKKWAADIQSSLERGEKHFPQTEELP